MVKILTSTGYIEEQKLNQILGTLTLKTFNAIVTYALTDSNNGKSFVIPNFPTNCIIKEIRVRSNLIAGQRRTWMVRIDNSNGIIPTDTSISYRGKWDSSPVGEYAYVDNEIVYIVADDGLSLTVTRGVKGTAPSYHDCNTPIKIANNGIRLILYKNSSKKLADRIKVLNTIMTWKGIVSTDIALNDRLIKFTDSILNVNKYDILYIIDGSNSERVSVEDISNIAKNNSYVNTVFVADPLFPHNANIEVRKQYVYDIPILYSGSYNLYGTVYVDEKIDDNLYPNGVTIDIEILTQ